MTRSAGRLLGAALLLPTIAIDLGCGRQTFGARRQRSLGVEFGPELAREFLHSPIVVEAEVLGAQRLRRPISSECEPFVDRTLECICLRVVVRALHAGILPAETLTVTSFAAWDEYAPTKAGDQILFFGGFVCTDADTLVGRIAVASGFWRDSQYEQGELHGDIMTGHMCKLSSHDLRVAARQPEPTARRRELAIIKSLILCRVSEHVPVPSDGESALCEPLTTLFGPWQLRPFRVVFHGTSLGCRPEISVGDSVVIPLRTGIVEPGRVNPLCFADLEVRNGFVKQFGCFYDRIVGRCYIESFGVLVPQYLPGWR